MRVNTAILIVLLTVTGTACLGQEAATAKFASIEPTVFFTKGDGGRLWQQAKVAIDTVAFIADKLHAHVSEDVRRALRSVVSDLQLNYVRHNE